ncbi:MAG: hypothetical protein ACE5DX_04995 [Candidatus Dojkabacteria bacterium]
MNIQDFFAQLDGRIFSFDFSNLVDTEYLFNTDPGVSEYIEWALAVTLVSLFISLFLSLFIKRFKRIDGVRRVIIRSAARRQLILSLVLLLLVFFRNQGFNVLSMRALVLLVVILMLVSLGYFAYWFIKRAPVKKKEVQKSSDYQKYLPKKKR